MGMSSSQARLLSLTARQHDIEYKAQRLEAQKLQMANESDSVYNEYLQAMDAKKIQTKLSNVWDDNGFTDATLNMMENQGVSSYTGKTASKNLFLEEISTGKIFITQQFATQHNLSTTLPVPDLDTYLASCGHAKSPVPVYGMHAVEDTNSVASFTPIANSSLTNYSETWGYSGAVKNSGGTGVDYAALAVYAQFNSSHAGVSGTALAPEVTTLTSGTTYTISDATQLQKLQALAASGVSTAGVTIKLADDIDMSAVSGWSGISNFQGTFDGDGHSINNLTGTQGLFASVNGATIENTKVVVGAAGINGVSDVGGLIGTSNGATTVSNCAVTGSGSVSGTGSNIGGLIGQSSSNSKAISEVYSTVNVSGTTNVGGLIGYYNASPGYTGTFTNAFSTGNVSGTTAVGGLFGAARFDPDKKDMSFETSVNNVYTSGNVTGSSATGGLIGDLFYWADYGDHLYFNNADTAAVVNGSDAKTGIFFGYLHETTTDTGSWMADNGYTMDSSVHFTESSYATNINSSLGAGTSNPTLVGQYADANTQMDGDNENIGTFVVTPKTPSVNSDGTGGLYSNIYAALIKSGSIKPTDMTPAQLTATQNSIKTFINSFSNDATGNAKLYNLNTNIYKVLNDSTLDITDTTFMTQLATDINNGTTTNTATYQNNGLTASDDVHRSTTSDAWDPTYSLTKGTLSIPSIKTIASELALAFKKAGYTSNDITSNLEAYLTANYSDTSDSVTGTINKAYLAELNQIVANNSTAGVDADSDLLALYSAYSGSTKYTAKAIDQDILDHPDRYKITMSGADQSSTVTNSVQHGTKQEQYLVRTDLVWDYTDTSIAADKAFWDTLQGGFIVVNEDMSGSSNWLTNMVNQGVAQFTSFDITTGAKTSTNVATETSLQEVSDATYLKKAEAKYEADMRKINSKETRIDNDLSRLDNERTAIKTETDTLKQTIKDNVNLNFKLFS